MSTFDQKIRIILLISIYIIASSCSKIIYTDNIQVYYKDKYKYYWITSDPKDNMAVVFRVKNDFRLIEENLYNTSASINICNSSDRYSDISNVWVKDASKSEFVAFFPSGNSLRTHWESNGVVASGWPDREVQEQGVCLKVVIWGTLGPRGQSAEQPLNLPLTGENGNTPQIRSLPNSQKADQ